jgi:hypothetical protein
MPNPITTGAAGAHRTHAEVSADAPPVLRVDPDDVELKTRTALRLAWDMSMAFYATGCCVKCGVKLSAMVKHKPRCKVGEFERLAREVLTGYVEA